jgi:hypothetical protein
MAVITTLRTARKARKCNSCGTTIQPGQQYSRTAIPPGSDIGNDDWWVYAEHYPVTRCAGMESAR